MKIDINLKKVDHRRCTHCFFNFITDCNILNDTKFDCKGRKMFILDKSGDLTITLDLGDIE